LGGKDGALKLAVDDAAALRTIEALRADLDELAARSPKISVRVDAAKAAAELAALRAEFGLLDDTVASSAKSAEASLGGSGGGLLRAALALSPALIPVGAVAASALGAFAEAAAVAVLGIKGIKAEMAAGTVLGQDYSRQLGVLEKDFTGLEVAAVGLFSGFSKGVSDIHSLLPELTAETKQFSGYLGDAGEHIVHGLAGGFVTLQPLFTQLLQGATNLAAKFDSYANGGGLQKFGA
jgi:hypothetical protein